MNVRKILLSVAAVPAVLALSTGVALADDHGHDAGGHHAVGDDHGHHATGHDAGDDHGHHGAGHHRHHRAHS